MLRKLRTSAPLPVKFCVTNSRRLPPVSLDHIDVAALLKSVMEIKTELIKCQGNLQRQESLFHDKLNEQQAEIEALKSSSALQPSYAGVTRQASSAPPQAARQLRSAPSDTSPPPSSGAQSGTGGGTGRQQNARQSTTTRRTNTATHVGTNMLPAGRQQAGTMATSGANNDVPSPPEQTGEPSTRLISAQQGRYTADSEGFLTRVPRNRNVGRPQPTRGSRTGNRLRTVPVDDRCHTFVYNLHKECTALEVEAHIKEVLDDDDVTVIKPQLKRTDSSGFIVSCNRRHRDSLLDASTWEENVRARPYRPPRNAETAAAT